MAKTNSGRSRKYQALLQVALAVALLLIVNVLANSRIGGRPLYGALDLTEEKRFTLTNGTKELLNDLEEVVYVRVLLEGEFPAGFKRLQRATREMLEDFRSVSPYIEYEFSDPNEGSTEEINARREEFKEMGMIPTNLRTQDKEGAVQQLIYPYAIFYFGGRSMPVNILENEIPGVPSDVILNNAVALLEYKFAGAIQKLRRGYKPVVALTTGQGELAPMQTADLEKALFPFYEIGRLNLDSVVGLSPEDVRALIIAKPTRPFSEKNKFKLDQYVMNGGKLLWLLDRVAVSLDSLQPGRQFFPQVNNLGLEDLLFRYGIRFNDDLVLDLRSTRIPLATGAVGNAPQFDLFRYPYHVLALPQSNHPIVRSLEAINLFYPSSIDMSVRTKTEVEKQILLMSSENARYQKLPIGMDFNFLRYELDPEKFTYDSLVMGVLLEGVFPSLYENRVSQDNLDLLAQLNIPFKTESSPTRMIVVADGDVAANPVRSDGTVLPLGYNVFERYAFSNKDFLVNAVEYLLDETGVIEARGKEVKLRLLNVERAEAEAQFWRLLNIALPLILLALFGLAYNWMRRRRYARV